MGHCCEVSLWILDKHQRDLFLGQDGRGPGSCRIAADHRDGVGVSTLYLLGILQNSGPTPVK